MGLTLISSGKEALNSCPDVMRGRVLKPTKPLSE
jgi:hypothetical protein